MFKPRMMLYIASGLILTAFISCDDTNSPPPKQKPLQAKYEAPVAPEMTLNTDFMQLVLDHVKHKDLSTLNISEFSTEDEKHYVYSKLPKTLKQGLDSIYNSFVIECADRIHIDNKHLIITSNKTSSISTVSNLVPVLNITPAKLTRADSVSIYYVIKNSIESKKTKVLPKESSKVKKTK